MPSPLKQKPDRVPGQSLDERRQGFVEKKLLTPFMSAYFLVVFCIWEWVRYFFSFPPHPKIITFVVVVFLFYYFFLIRKNLDGIRLLTQGLDGERTVGIFLEKELAKCNCSVLHDFQDKKWNIDHILVCTKGIFTVETKTWGKKNSDNIIFDGLNIVVSGYRTRKPIDQVHAQVRGLQRILEGRMGRAFQIRPVIVFPGHFIEKDSTKLLLEKEGIWLLNPKALSTFIKNEPEVLNLEEVNSIVLSLRNYSRSQDL